MELPAGETDPTMFSITRRNGRWMSKGRNHMAAAPATTNHGSLAGGHSTDWGAWRSDSESPLVRRVRPPKEKPKSRSAFPLRAHSLRVFEPNQARPRLVW